jgi:hypothetical protein
MSEIYGFESWVENGKTQVSHVHTPQGTEMLCEYHCNGGKLYEADLHLFETKEEAEAERERLLSTNVEIDIYDYNW